MTGKGRSRYLLTDPVGIDGDDAIQMLVNDLENLIKVKIEVPIS